MRSSFVNRNLVRILILSLVLLPAYRQSALGELPLGSMAPNVEWYADFYPNNKEYVSVTIDARSLPRNTHISVDSIEITCAAARRRSATRKYTPADFGTQFSGLEAGAVYRGFFKHSCTTATSITGKLIHIHERTLGVKGGEGPRRRRGGGGENETPSYKGQPSRNKQFNINDQDIIVVGDLPPSK